MPREVDHEERRREIARAALSVLAENGLRGLTVRAIGRELGGSACLVTHYYPTRHDLLEGIPSMLAEEWQTDLTAIHDSASDPRRRLRNLLLWMLPLRDDEVVEDRAFLNLLSAPEADRESVGRIHGEFHSMMTGLIRQYLAGLVDEERIDTIASLLRATTTGVALSALEYPEAWPAEHQVNVLDELLGLLGLAPASD